MDALSLVLIAVVIWLLFYRYGMPNTGLFENNGVKYMKPIPILGNMGPVLFRRISMPDHLQAMYNKFSDTKYFGFFQFQNPVYFIRDPELINQIAVKNFDNFTDHRSVADEVRDPLMAKNLFSLRGDYWREMRRLLSPTFTSSKMRMMYELIVQCAEEFADCMRQEAGDGTVMNMKDTLSRYTNDVVATCAFGISVNSMKDPNNDFYTFGKKTLTFNSSLSLKFFLGSSLKSVSSFLKLTLFPRYVTDFFVDIVGKTVEMRKKHGTTRPDMIQLMMECKEKGMDMSILEMTSHAFVFFFAGFDSTATFMCFLVHELAMHSEVRAKLLKEIEDVLKETNGRPTYEAILQMKYLDAVINETLRLYPLTANLDRVCVKEFQLPPAGPGAKPVTVKPGDSIWLPTYPLHRDPTYFPDPNSFKPERFLNKEVDNAVYIPFGIGPRMCIGNRFALLESKVMIVCLLAACELEPCDKTPDPMILSKKSFVMLSEKGFWLRVRARENSLLSCNNVITT